MTESKKVSLCLLKIQEESIKTYNKILALYKDVFISESRLITENSNLLQILGPFQIDETMLLNEKMVSQFKKDSNLVELLAVKLIRERVARFLTNYEEVCLMESGLESSRQRTSTKLSECSSAKICASKQKRFSKEVIEYMEKFFKKSPYPSEAEKVLISQYCGLTNKQVSNWFTNKRNRTKL
ncbi:Homeobox protein six2 [Mitosporidium daphniae]